VKSLDITIINEIRDIRKQWPRYGYRRLTAELQDRGWRLNAKRTARICRQNDLKILSVRRKRRYLGSAEGGITRLRAERPNHVWAIDFVHDRTADGRMLKILVDLPSISSTTRYECRVIRESNEVPVAGRAGGRGAAPTGGTPSDAT